MITTIKLQGIKSFFDKSEFVFAPLTLLTGTNSSGKSTIFQILLAIKQTYEYPLTHYAGLHLNGKRINIGTYKDWSSEHKEGPTSIEVSLGTIPFNWDLIPNERRKPESSMTRSVELRPQFWWMPTSGLWALAQPETATCTVMLELGKSGDLSSVAYLKSLHIETAMIGKNSSHSTFVLNLLQKTDAISQESLVQIDGMLTENTNFDFDIDIYETLREASTDRHADGATTREPIVLADHKANAAVDGLTATAVLYPTLTPAVDANVHKLITLSLEAFVELITKVEVTNVSNRFNPESHLLSFGINRSQQARTVNFIQKCDLIDLCKFLSFDATRTYLVSFFGGQIEKSRLQPIHLEIFSELFKRLIAVLRSFSNAEKSSVNIPEESENVRKMTASLKDFFGKRHLVFDFCSVLATRFSSVHSSTILSLLERCDTQAKEREPEYAIASVRQWLDQPDSRQKRTEYYYRTGARRDKRLSEANLRSYFVNSLYHLGPLREEPRKLYVSEPPASITDVGPRGERAIACLRWFGNEIILAPSVPSGDLCSIDVSPQRFLDAVINWGKYLNIFGDLRVDSDARFGTICEVVIDVSDEFIQADLTNVGTGVSQLLPVIVLCLSAAAGSTILIEQPELHLHPAIQSKLAIFFAACIRSGRQIVVETHSEHIINRLRLMSVREYIRPKEDLSILFLTRDKFGSEIIKIEILPDGSLDRWPDQFFDETERVLAETLRSKIQQ